MDNGITNPKLDELMDETVVVRAVDDGDGVILQAPVDDTRGPYESKIPFEHWAVEGSSPERSVSPSTMEGAKLKLRAVKGDLKHAVDGMKDDLKYRGQAIKGKVSHAGDVAKAKVSAAGEMAKTKVMAADQTIKANPYLYALGAVAVGFALGRLIMSSKKSATQKYDVSDFKDNTNQHTGVHIRSESRYGSY